MAYSKGSSGGGAFMNNGKGMCSTKDNPMKAARQIKPECGPGMNADQKKANKLLQQAQKQQDSLRGMSGM
jgi:hypothetical protein